MTNVISIADHQPDDLSERQAARALGIDAAAFRSAQSAGILPPSKRDHQGSPLWSRESVRAAVELFCEDGERSRYSTSSAVVEKDGRRNSSAIRPSTDIVSSRSER